MALNHLTIAFYMILFGGMQNFEASFQEFLTQVKTRFDAQNATLAEYENFFQKAQELIPTYEAFIHQMSDGLTSIQETLQNQTPAPSAKKSVAAPKLDVDLSKIQTPVERKKILVVDDAEINRVLMGHFFKNMPVDLEFAVSGEQALEKINQNIFDLIMMDLQMKGISGMETIKSIRASQPENLKRTQIVAISNQSPTEEERTETLNAGANEYLTKSMSRDAIKERVFEFLFGTSALSRGA